MPSSTVWIVPMCGADVDFRKCAPEVQSFKLKDTGIDFAGRFRFGPGSGIPYGTYQVAFYFADAFFSVPIVRTVNISQVNVRWVVDLRTQQPIGVER
jgi:hypothetical protein